MLFRSVLKARSDERPIGRAIDLIIGEREEKYNRPHLRFNSFRRAREGPKFCSHTTIYLC